MKTEDELDAEIAKMFDEVKEVRVETVNGKPNLVCIASNCPLCVFWEPISRSIRLFFGEKE